MRIQVSNIFITLFTGLLLVAFNRADKSKIEILQSQNIVYTEYGNGCSIYKDTYTLYGFKIKCGGCNLSTVKIEENANAIKSIDSIYGKGWFKANYESFIIPFDE